MGGMREKIAHGLTNGGGDEKDREREESWSALTTWKIYLRPPIRMIEHTLKMIELPENS